MKWFLVLYFAGLGGQGATVATSIGPYDDREGCLAIGSQMAMKDGWKGFCYPVGTIPLKTPAVKKPDASSPTTKKP